MTLVIKLPANLMRLALAEYLGGIWLKAINDIVGNVTSANENEILEYLRETSGHTDPALNDKLRLAIHNSLTQ